MEEAEGDGEVDVEVDRVPGLVRGAGSGRSNRADGHDDEEPECYDRPQHVGIGVHQREELVDDVGVDAHRVTDGREDPVEDEKPDRGEPDPAVCGGDPVLPEDLVEPGAPGHQYQLAQDEVGAVQGADLAGGGEDAGRGAELVEAAVADPHADDQQADAAEDGVEVVGRNGPDPRGGNATGLTGRRRRMGGVASRVSAAHRVILAPALALRSA